VVPDGCADHSAADKSKGPPFGPHRFAATDESFLNNSPVNPLRHLLIRNRKRVPIYGEQHTLEALDTIVRAQS
jgi:hypothetical protein